MTPNDRSVRQASHQTKMLYQMAHSANNGKTQERSQLEEELCRVKAELEGYRTLYDNAPTLSFTLTPDGLILAVNQYAMEYLGYAAEVLIEQSIFTIFHPDDQAKLQADFDAFVDQSLQSASLETAVWEYRQLHQSGSALWVKITARVLQNAQTVPVVLLVCEDITERKQVESRLYLLEQAVVNSCNSIIITDALQPDHPIIYTNPCFERTTGYSAAEVIGQNCRLLQGEDVGQPELDELRAAIRDGRECHVTVRNYRKDGSLFWNELHVSPIRDASGAVISFVGVQTDVTERRRAEEAQQESETRLHLALEAAHMRSWEWDIATNRITSIGVVPATLQVLEAALEDHLEPTCENYLNLIYEPDREAIAQAIACILADETEFQLEFRLVRPDHQLIWLCCQGRVCRDESGEPLRLLGVVTDITSRKQTEEYLRCQAEQERLTAVVSQRIRRSLDLDETLNTVVTEVQQMLQVDRVMVYRLRPDCTGQVTHEAVAPHVASILGLKLPAEVFPQDCYSQYLQGRIRTVTDVEQDEISACLIDFLQQLGVRSKLVVPLVRGEVLWGLLIAHQCNTARQWQATEVEVLRQLAAQVEIAIQQAELYRQVQQLNTNLEVQVQERTAQLQQALEFESTLKRITDHVRDSLDEDQILQTVVRELGTALDVDYCNTALYDEDLQAIQASYEYAKSATKFTDLLLPSMQFPQIYQQLQRGASFQLCTQVAMLPSTWTAVLMCSIFDNDQALGDLLLMKPKERTFTELELRFVQQVANQCAIAIRQARLHQAVQAQVRELQRLNQLKDDFLSTVSHELRSPVSNMKMAIQMLYITNDRAGLAAATSDMSEQQQRFTRYMQILQDECEREIDLINDLLDLQRLEAGTQPFRAAAIDLDIWLAQLVEPFQERAHSRHQIFQVSLDDYLPPLISDAAHLKRVIAELLNNACKYTPPGERIVMSAKTIADKVHLTVCNFGVEISAEEQARIFDKFYRIPHADPWRQGGTGLGLALVRQLVGLLGGQVQVESAEGQTCFRLELPVQNPFH